MDIVIDFDGTCIIHGDLETSIGAEGVLRKLVSCGHNLILSTMRSNKPFLMSNGDVDIHGLDNALKWFKVNGIDLYGVYVNPKQKEWTDSPKAHGQLYIGDDAIGCPLKTTNGKPHADWAEIDKVLKKMGLYND